MGKISSYTANTAPLLTDFLPEDTVSGPTTETVTISRLLSLLFSTDSIGTWQSFTPTVVLNGGTSSGNATITGSYVQIGKTVHFWVSYALGSTTNFTGLTSFTCSLPVTASSAWATGIGAGGSFTGLAVEPGVFFPLTNYAQTTTTFNPAVINAASTYAELTQIAASIPFSWGASSSYYWTMAGTYEAA